MTQEKQKIKALLPVAFKGGYIAGGALTSVFTNQPINDVDVYFKTEVDFMRAVAEMVIYAGGYCLDISERAVTFSCDGDIVQLCRLGFFQTPQDIFDSFDFTCCMAAYDVDTDTIVFHEDFLKHNSQRYLKFNPKTKYPLASMLRTIKYQQKGYTIGKGEVLKILLACSKVNLQSWDDLENQIGGAYGKKLSLNKEDKGEFSVDAAIELIGEELEWVSTLGGDVPECRWGARKPYEEVLLEALGYSDERVKEFFDKEYNQKETN